MTKKIIAPEDETPKTGHENVNENTTPEVSENQVISALQEQVKSLSSVVEQLSLNKGSGAKEIAEAIRDSQAVSGSGPSDMLIGESEIDPDDYLSEMDQILFFAPHAYYVIVDDIRKGRPVFTPFKTPIVFLYAGGDRVRTSRGYTINVYSQYVCKSKKEAEWLRSHRHYGLYFFENQKKALTLDHMAMKAMAAHYSAVQGMEPSAVIQNMMQYDELRGRIGKDVEQNKRELAFFLGVRDKERLRAQIEGQGGNLYKGGPVSEEEMAGLEKRV